MSVRVQDPGAPAAVSAPGGIRRQTLETRIRAVERVIGAMDSRYGEPLSVTCLARIALFSPYHFDRFFAEITGVPPLRFLTAVRIQKAKQLLLHSHYSVTRISCEVGYNSLGTFTRQFTEFVGVAPGRFRRFADAVNRSCHAALGSAAPGVRAVPTPARAPARPGLVTLPRDALFPRPTEEAPQTLGVEVEVQPLAGFSGRVFVGLFPDAIPRSRPVACAILHRPGLARMAPVPPGAYYAFAAGLPLSADPADALLCADAPRGRAGPLRVEPGHPSPRAPLELHPPRTTDPPLLLALPFIFAERLGRGRGEGRRGQRAGRSREAAPLQPAAGGWR